MYPYITWDSEFWQDQKGCMDIFGLRGEIRNNFPNFFLFPSVLSLSAFLGFQLPGWHFADLSSASFGEVLNQSDRAWFAWEDSDGFIINNNLGTFASTPAAKTAGAWNLPVAIETALREKSFFHVRIVCLF